jgi:hypothetical protein
MYVGTSFRQVSVLASSYYFLILITFLASLPKVTRDLVRVRSPALIMHGMILATIIMALIFHGQHRYRFPIDSLCMVMAAAGLSHVVAVVGRGGLGELMAGWGRWVQSNRRLVTAGVVLVLAGLAISEADRFRIENYRDQECRRRLHAIQDALSSFCQAKGRMPAGLGELIPEYVPDIDHLHCPKHSLSWHTYMLLGRRDASGLESLFSYTLVQPAGSDGSVRVVEDQPRHFGCRNAVELDGALAQGKRGRDPALRAVNTMGLIPDRLGRE